MESKHTPGPWRADESGHRREWSHWLFKGKGRHELIGAVSEINGNSEEANANARLIAAAPELYAACEFMVGENDENDGFGISFKALDMARAAIAKATGERP